ncbi:hypothetical protein [Thalassococcus profundi]|uniref:hypothetical protein n=1 Tax=Thalassococcus profundi TaxID=2282382 RepID=UPI0018F13A54|nr:hypothetical protein [Thalassococcus profundi]
MRKYAFRKQTRSDFDSRLKRLDPAFSKHGHKAYQKDTTPERPILCALAGFGWFYLVIGIARNKAYIQDSLLQGSLAPQHQDLVVSGLGALLAVSGVMILLHLVRFFLKSGPRRTNSRNLLMGATAALALVYTPPSVFQAGLGMMDENSRSLILAAHSTVKSSVPGVDWDKVALVTSLGQ